MLYADPDDRSSRRLRDMYRGRRGNATARRYARFWAAISALGLTPRRFVTLEVTGAKTGLPRRFPLGIAAVGGQEYLVSMLGECQWVRNVRAAGGVATLVHGRRRPVHLAEVPVDERGPILQGYVAQVPGGRPHIPVRPGSPLEEFAAVAADYPAFEIRPR